MDVKRAIIESNFKFNKRFGQNFIEDKALLQKIVEGAGVTETDVVLEIGVGAGTLTRALSEKAKRVVGYEIDLNLKPVLERTLSGVENAEVVFRDFMKQEMAAVETLMGEEYLVVANLPYYVTTPILMKLIEQAKNCKRIVVMVQKEVADRFCAKCATADYGAVTVAIDVTADAYKIMDVKRENFYPVPNVDSAVVRIDINKNKYNPLSKKAFRDAVRCAFSSRRKTLQNNLINTYKIPRFKAEALLEKAGVPLLARGETLSTEEFVKLSDILFESGIIE